MRLEACSRHSRHCFWGYCRSIDAIGCQSDIAQKIIEKERPLRPLAERQPRFARHLIGVHPGGDAIEIVEQQAEMI
jgi:hypothetical protein